MEGFEKCSIKFSVVTGCSALCLVPRVVWLFLRRGGARGGHSSRLTSLHSSFMIKPINLILCTVIVLYCMDTSK